MIEKRRTLYRQWVPLGAALVLSFCLLAPAWSADKPAKAKTPKIEPKAVEVLQQMCDYLKNLQQFSVQAEITEDVLLTSGQRIQYSRNVEASVRRPDRMRAESVGGTDDRQLVYDGKTITLMDRPRTFTPPSPPPRSSMPPWSTLPRPLISGPLWLI